jgi:hypothetical protein
MPTVLSPRKPNASLQLLPEAGAERSKAEAGGSQLQGIVRCFGCYAATQPKGTGTVNAFLAILPSRPWAVVTVLALVLRARLLGWSREVAATALVTGPVLIPFGRLHVSLSLPPPRRSLVLFPTAGDSYDTPQRLLP